MGWSEARKDKERGYFDSEASDPLLEKLLGSEDQQVA
jgi:hypothetical protein